MTIFSPIILGGNNDQEVSILKEYAEFWKVPFSLVSRTDEKNLLLTTSAESTVDPNTSNSAIISPVGIDGAREIARRFQLEFTSSKQTQVRMRASLGSFVSFRANLYQFSGYGLEEVLNDGHNPILYKFGGSNVHILSIDLVTEYRKLLYERMDESANWKFRFLTRMPLSYNLIPSRIRNRAFKTRDPISVEEETYGPVECLRSIFLASLVVVSPVPIPIIRFWRRGKSYALAISHDVESQVGLEDGASRLIEVEKELGVRSTWNVPSDRYPLSSQLLTMLASNGEVGAHDTKHDGKLIFMKDNSKQERVRQCKERLERLSGKEVRGFRAPLLQHSRRLVQALSQVGYGYDSSMPSWEPLSPTSLKPHGVGTIFPFLLSDIVEVPVSMPQDHQLIRAGGFSVSEAVEYLSKLSRWVKNAGGACVLLVHPDYEFSDEEGLEEYRRLLGTFRSDPFCDIMTLGELAQWWTHRHQSYIDDSGRIETKSSDGRGNSDGELEVAHVTGYGPDGFTIQSPNMINMFEANDNSKRRT